MLVGSAVFAEARLGIPTYIGANPVAAAGALLEILFAFEYRLFHCLVVRFAANSPLHMIGGIASLMEHAPKQTTRGIEQAPGNADGIGLEARHVAVAAFVAVELELEPFVSR